MRATSFKAMTIKKAALQAVLGPSRRPQGESPRTRYLYTDVTKAEHQKIRAHCAKLGITVSRFLADLMLEDVENPKPRGKQRIIIKVEIELTEDQLSKVEMLTRLHEKESIGQFLRSILDPYLTVQRLHVPLKTISLRYYLSGEEHKKVLKHVASRGISARNYAAMLALRAIRSASSPSDPRQQLL